MQEPTGPAPAPSPRPAREVRTIWTAPQDAPAAHTWRCTGCATYVTSALAVCETCGYDRRDTPERHEEWSSMSPSPLSEAAADLARRSHRTGEATDALASDIAAALDAVATRTGASPVQIRSWLDTDMSPAVNARTVGEDPTVALLKYGTSPAEVQDVLRGRLTDALTRAEQAQGLPTTYDYAADPRPEHAVVLTWSDGDTDTDAVKAHTAAEALEGARANWPGATVTLADAVEEAVPCW